MGIRGVLFDFVGTLFWQSRDESWFAGLTDAEGRPLDVAELSQRFRSPITAFTAFDDEHQHAWDNRDLDPALNRKAFVEIFRQGGVVVREQADALYDKVNDPALWDPYPDTRHALRALAAQRIPVAVVSNIGFDIRPVFARHGLDGYIDEFVLSFEAGVVKPDPEIFRIALGKIGVEPAAALMVGDHEEADGGARAIGAAFELVPHQPTAERPNALVNALRMHGAVRPS